MNSICRNLAFTLGLLVFSSFSFGQQTAGTRPEVGIQEHKNDVIAIQNATVVPETGKILEKATIVVRDGKIVEIGVHVSPPPEAQIIDMTGKTFYAGFVDAGIEIDVLPSDATKGTPHWNSEITPERSMADVISANEATMGKLRKAGIMAALVAPRNGIIKERWIHCHSFRQDEILGLLRVLDEDNIKIGSLQHILEGYKVADAIAKHGGTASTFSD